MKSVLKQEFIGLTIEIVNSQNKANIGLKGKIIDETKATFLIESKNKTQSTNKKLLKKNITFITTLEGKRVKIEGKYLAFRPEDRIKKSK